MYENTGNPYQDSWKMKGTYCLILYCRQAFSASIGKLGIINFLAGGYIYTGSALNSLKKRVARHLAKEKKIFWHIDYLLEYNHIHLDYIFYLDLPIKNECPTARLLAERLRECAGFGSSDCKCRSHLFYFKNKEKQTVFKLLFKAGYRLSTPQEWLIWLFF